MSFFLNPQNYYHKICEYFAIAFSTLCITEKQRKIINFAVINMMLITMLYG